MSIQELLEVTISRNASDLHLMAGRSPSVRINGQLHSLVTFTELSVKDIEEMVFSLLNPAQKELLLTNKELDFSTTYSPDEDTIYRFRVNAYFQTGALAIAFRLIPAKIKSIDELKLPPVLHEIAKLRHGFVLMTGPTGQGKSTTLASVIQEINMSRSAHIISIEDPIEYIYPKGKCLISQREMYQDTHSFKNALKYILREDPDIVYIGEMRDAETIGSALTIAETGHLVFSTLHTNSTAQTIDRIIDSFPPSAQSQIRMQLSMVLSAVVSQRLIPSTNNVRIPVCEILLGNGAVKNTIREGKTHLIDNIIQTSKDSGMMIFEEHLKQLVAEGTISPDIALEYALRPDRYLELMQR